MPERLRQLLPWVAVLLIGLLPQMLEGGYRGYFQSVVLFVQVYIILALGLNVVVGYTGLLDLGYASFMAIGAVVTSAGLMLTSTPEGLVLPFIDSADGTLPLNFEGSILLILFAAGVCGAVFGVLRGIPTLRLTGDYYAIVTLGIAEILYEVFKNNEAWTGGAFGIVVTRKHRAVLFGEKFNYASPQCWFLFLAILVITVVCLRRLQYSRIGRAWAAIRLDETAAATNGVNVSAYKMLAFAISGFVGSVGGGLYALWASGVAVNTIDIWQSILILCILVLGGMGAIRGAIVAGTALILLGELPKFQLGELLGWLPLDAMNIDDTFRIPPESRFLIYGLVLILMMRFRPEGLLPTKAQTTGLGAAELERRASNPGRLYHLGDADGE